MNAAELFPSYPEIVTVSDVCGMMNICKRTAYKLIKNGDLASMKVGKKILIPKAKIIDFVNEKTG